MKLLAIDTSSKVLGVAVLDEEGRGAEFNYGLGLRHASHLVPTIKNVLKFAGLGLDDIDAYAVSIGPGSFTGLRIGVSAVKALSLAKKRKVVAVPTLDVLAHNVPNTKEKICVIVDAKKEKFYVCFYEYKDNRLKRLTPYLLIGPDELVGRIEKIKPAIFLGDGLERTRELTHLHTYTLTHLTNGATFLDEGFWYPRAINVARIGLEMLKKGKIVKDVDALVPLYLHPRDVQCRKHPE